MNKYIKISKKRLMISLVLLCFFIVFILFFPNLKQSPLFKRECLKKEVNMQSALNSFFEKMREDRIDDRKKYESCNYDQSCEIWVLPKINIYELDKRMHDFMYYESNTEATVTLSGEIMNITELNITKFFNTLNAVPMDETFKIDELKTKSVIHHEGSYFYLYNQEYFAIKNNMLLVNLKGLGSVNEGPSYRLDTDYLQPPSYDGHFERRDYPLNQCSEITHFFNFKFTSDKE